MNVVETIIHGFKYLLGIEEGSSADTDTDEIKPGRSSTPSASTSGPIKLGKSAWLTVHDDLAGPGGMSADISVKGPVGIGASGELAVNIRTPKVRLFYDESHWKGSGLTEWDSGTYLSWSLGNDFVRKYAMNGPPTYYPGMNRIGKSEYFYYRKIPAGYPDHAGLVMPLLGGITPNPAGVKIAAHREMLEKAGFTRVDSVNTTLELPVGKYIIIAEPPCDYGLVEWGMLKGYWTWGAHGPTGLSKQENVQRLADEKWTKKLTRFDRMFTVEAWDHISTVATVEPNQTITASITPVETLRVSNKWHIETSYSKNFYRVCKGLSYFDSLTGGMIDKILDIVAKYL